MQSRALALGMMVVALMLAGCNEPQPVASAPPPPAATSAAVPAAAKFANLPQGAVCTKKIHRYQSVLASDVATGNLEQKVYDEIEKELRLAAADCLDGLNRESLQLVHASEIRHGYNI